MLRLDGEFVVGDPLSVNAQEPQSPERVELLPIPLAWQPSIFALPHDDRPSEALEPCNKRVVLPTDDNAGPGFKDTLDESTEVVALAEQEIHVHFEAPSKGAPAGYADVRRTFAALSYPHGAIFND
jgi:hypothetical protein